MPYDRLEKDAQDAPSAFMDAARAGEGVSLPGWVVVGALSGAAFVGLVCLIALPEKQSIATVSARALCYTAASGSAGAAVIAMLWTMLRPRHLVAPAGFVQLAAEACAFLPCIVLLQIKQSYWMLGFATIATFIVWRGVRPMVRPDQWARHDTENAPHREFAALYGLPVERLPVGWMVFLAVCLQGAGITAVAGFLVWASSLLSMGLLALMWRWTATQPRRRAYAACGWREFAGTTGFAVLLTIVFLISPRQGAGGLAERRAARRAGERMAKAAIAIAAMDMRELSCCRPR